MPPALTGHWSMIGVSWRNELQRDFSGRWFIPYRGARSDHAAHDRLWGRLWDRLRSVMPSFGRSVALHRS